MSETTYTSHTWQEGELITAELMNHLEQGIANISSASSGSSQTIDPELSNRVEALETSNADAVERIGALEDFKSSVTERIDSDETAFANYVNSFEPSITNRVSSLETSNTTITNRVGRLENSNTNIIERIESLESDTEITDRMDQQDISISALNSNLQKMSTIFISSYNQDNYSGTAGAVMDVYQSHITNYKIGNLGILQYTPLIAFGEVPDYIEIAQLQDGFIAYGSNYYEMSGCPLAIFQGTIYLKAGTYQSENELQGQLIYIIDPDSTNESQGEDSNA